MCKCATPGCTPDHQASSGLPAHTEGPFWWTFGTLCPFFDEMTPTVNYSHFSVASFCQQGHVCPNVLPYAESCFPCSKASLIELWMNACSIHFPDPVPLWWLEWRKNLCTAPPSRRWHLCTCNERGKLWRRFPSSRPFAVSVCEAWSNKEQGLFKYIS